MLTMLYQQYGSAGTAGLDLHPVHERPRQEDSPSGLTQKILRRQRIGHRIGIEAPALIANADHQVALRDIELDGDFFAAVVGVAMHDRVDRDLAHRHGDPVAVAFVEPGVFGNPLGCRFGLVHAFNAAVENDRLMLIHRYHIATKNPDAQATPAGKDNSDRTVPTWHEWR